MTMKSLGISIVAALAFASGAQATTLTFEDLAEGATLSNQYASLGAIFSANAFSGAGGPTGDWASNTTMSITAVDTGALGTPTGTVSGKLLHSYGSTTTGWLDEDGDPSFKVTFSSAATNFSAAFAGVSTPGDVKLFIYNGATLVSTVAGTVTTGQFVLSYNATPFTSVAITPGSYFDWVGVDNISYTLAPVPEPETCALMALGIASIGLAMRRRRQG